MDSDPNQQRAGQLPRQPLSDQTGSSVRENQRSGNTTSVTEVGNVPQARSVPRVSSDLNNFMKLAPKFYLGEEAWELFFERFQNLAATFQVSNDHFKSVLYGCLAGEAFALASPNHAPR